jgi:hypothetical protein
LCGGVELREGKRGDDHDREHDRCRRKTACRRGSLPFRILQGQFIVSLIVEEFNGDCIVYFVRIHEITCFDLGPDGTGLRRFDLGVVFRVPLVLFL